MQIPLARQFLASFSKILNNFLAEQVFIVPSLPAVIQNLVACHANRPSNKGSLLIEVAILLNQRHSHPLEDFLGVPGNRYEHAYKGRNLRLGSRPKSGKLGGIGGFH